MAAYVRNIQFTPGQTFLDGATVNTLTFQYTSTTAVTSDVKVYLKQHPINGSGTSLGVYELNFSGVVDALTFTLPPEWNAFVPNSPGWAILMAVIQPCDGNGSPYGDPASLPATVYVDAAQIPPVLDTMTLYRLDDGQPMDAFLQGKSQAVLDFTGVYAQYGANIATIRINTGVPGFTNILLNGAPTSYTIPCTFPAGTQTIVVTATDTRNQSSVKQFTFEVLSYQLPQITAHMAERVDSGGNSSTLGNTLKVSCSYTADTMYGANPASCVCAWKAAGGSPSSPIPLTNGVAALIASGQINAPTSYVVTFTVTDSLNGVSTLDVPVPSISVAVDYLAGGKGAAFGGDATTANLLDVFWNLRVRGNLQVDGTFPGMTRSGIYTGTGQASVTVNLGARPKAVFVYCLQFPPMYTSGATNRVYMGFATGTSYGSMGVDLTNNGFTVYQNTNLLGNTAPWLNESGTQYAYFAIL